MDYPLHGKWWIPCAHCGQPNYIQDKIFDEYFSEKKEICLNSNCKQSFDWWEAILKAIRENFFLVQALAPIGAQLTIFPIILRPEEIEKITFSDHGIPPDAEILQVNYFRTAGNLSPLEIHGNTPQRHIIPQKIQLYPRPFPLEIPQESTVNVTVTWIHHTSDDESWHNLVRAFRDYVDGRYEAAVIPANVAVESILSRTMAEFLKKNASRDNVERFLEDGAKYGHQLNVLLPNILSFTKAPPLPEHIRGGLNRLRKLRNQLAHEGKLSEKLKKDEVAELLCASLFGFHYLKLIRLVLLP